jgi:uncharacterized protein YkwD
MRWASCIAAVLSLVTAPLTAVLPPHGGARTAELTRKRNRPPAPHAKPATKPKPVPAAQPVPAAIATPASIQPDPQSFNGRLLTAHNAERARLGIAPLVWSDTLSAQAAVWVESLALKGQFQHGRNLGNVGENLWEGPSGLDSPEVMVERWVREGQYFRPGKFPDVTTTDDWMDVGHYTQLIWPSTRAVGCALASGTDETGQEVDLLDCRYSPRGNVDGQQIP